MEGELGPRNHYQRQAEMAIRAVEIQDLPECLALIRKSFGTVAAEFGLTEENAPTNGAFLRMERLRRHFDRGDWMFAQERDGRIVGFVQLVRKSKDRFELEKLGVDPQWRHRGYGAGLVAFAAARAGEAGASRLTIGIIEENVRLKEWYGRQGFRHAGTKCFEHLPFLVGFMERALGAEAGDAGAVSK